MELTHINEQGRAKMVDVSEKIDTVREDIAVVRKSGGKSGIVERKAL